MKLPISLAAFIILLSTSALIARAADKTIALSGKTGCGQKYSLTAVIGTVPRLTDATPEQWGVWGESEYYKFQPPSTGIKSFLLLVNSKEVYFPRKALWDLRNPREIWITIPKDRYNRLQIHISGSDAGESYSAVFNIDNGFLHERFVRHVEFPDECWERTTYSWTDEQLPNM